MDTDSLFASFIDTYRVANRRPALSSSKFPQLSSPSMPGFLHPTPYTASILTTTPISPSSWGFYPSLLRSVYHMPSSCRNISLRVSISHQHSSFYCFLRPTIRKDSIRAEQKTATTGTSVVCVFYRKIRLGENYGIGLVFQYLRQRFHSSTVRRVGWFYADTTLTTPIVINVRDYLRFTLYTPLTSSDRDAPNTRLTTSSVRHLRRHSARCLRNYCWAPAIQWILRLLPAQNSHLRCLDRRQPVRVGRRKRIQERGEHRLDRRKVCGVRERYRRRVVQTYWKRGFVEE